MIASNSNFDIKLEDLNTTNGNLAENETDYNVSWQFNNANYGINIDRAWEYYSGEGVYLGVLDEGFDYSDPELSRKFRTDLDYNYVDNTDETLKNYNGHGTNVMKFAAGDINEHGSAGPAYNSELIGYAVQFGGGSSLVDGFQASCNDENSDIVNHSWKFTNPFQVNINENSYFKTLLTDYIDTAVDTGRDGLGKLLVFAAGNDRASGHVSGQDSLKANMKTLVVGAHNDDGNHTWFSEEGTNLLVSAPGEAVPYEYDGSTYLGNGTSYAAPIVSGVIALMLEANPNLGWRDVMEIIALSAKKIDFSGTNSDNPWIENAAVNWNGGGNYFNVDYGFGGIDASAAVHLAENWTSTPKTSSNMVEVTASATIADGSVTDGSGYSAYQINFDGTDVNIDKVGLLIDFGGSIIGDARIELISPDGTASVLLDAGHSSSRTSLNFEFISNAFWGEQINGTWEVRFYDTDADGETFTINSIDMRAIGDSDSSQSTFYYTDHLSELVSDSSRLVISDTGELSHSLNAAAVSSNINIDVSDLANSTIQIDGVSLTLDGSLQSVNHTIDHWILGQGDDTFRDHAGNSYINGGWGDDTIYGNDGDDILCGGKGNDILCGGVGDDTYYIDSLYDQAIEYGNEGNDTVYLENSLWNIADIEHLFNYFEHFENVYLNGELINVSAPGIINGTEGDDNLTGTANADEINGLGGNDVLDGGLGNDILNGGLGDDTYHVRTAGDSVNENEDEGNDTIIWHDDTKTEIDLTSEYDHVENVDASNSTSITNIIGSDANNILTGNANNNVIDGGAGADTMIGGTGDDTYSVDNIADVVTENFNEGNDTIVWLEDTLVNVNLSDFANIENFDGRNSSSILTIDGTNENNTIFGNANNNTIQAGAGNDTLDGDIGSDTLIGGSGDDTYYINDITDVVVEEENGGTDTVYIQNENLEYSDIRHLNNYFENVENVYLNGTLVDIAPPSRMDGTSGDDVINGSIMEDAINGYAGNDILNGLNGDDTIDAGTGNDVLNGGAGDDTLIGGAGDDTYHVDSREDIVRENENEGNDTIVLDEGWSGSLIFDLNEYDNVENLDASNNTAAYGLWGTEADNHIIGNSRGNSFLARGGQDVFEGKGGDDTYFIDSHGHTIIENANEGDDKVQLMGGNIQSYTLDNNVETLDAAQSRSAITLNGNNGNNIIKGNNLSNLINGGAGDDIMKGGRGDDTYYVNSLQDVVKEYTDQGNDTVYLENASWQLNDVKKLFNNYQNIENVYLNGVNITDQIFITQDNIDGTENDDWLNGNNNDNIINGLGGNDYINGNAGNDTLHGGSGHDFLRSKLGDNIIHGDDGNDRVVTGNGKDTIYGGAGNDKIKAGGGDDTIYGGNDTDLIWAGDGDDNVDGGAGSDFIKGGEGNDVINGGEGNDIIWGNSGDDEIIGGAGNDYISGGDGIDHIYGGEGQNFLRGGNGNDQLWGGSSSDFFMGEGGADQMTGGDGNDYYWVDNTADVVIEEVNEGNRDIVFFSGSYSNDTYRLNDNVEILKIYSGNALRFEGNNDKNFIFGSNNDEVIHGLGGNDNINGGDGNDTIWGGNGRDFMRGGSGNDTFVFDSNDTGGRDFVRDFSRGQDQIDLSSFFDQIGYSGNDAIGDGYIYFVNSGSHTNLYFDENGTGSNGQHLALIFNEQDTDFLNSDFII